MSHIHRKLIQKTATLNKRKWLAIPQPKVSLTCPYDFKIYVYDLFAGEAQNHLIEALETRDPFCQNDCSDAQFSTEVHLWRYLLQSPCRTSNADDADLLYLPFLSTLDYYSPRRTVTAPAIYKGLVEQNWTDFESVRLLLAVDNRSNCSRHFKSIQGACKSITV